MRETEEVRKEVEEGQKADRETGNPEPHFGRVGYGSTGEATST